MNIIEFFVNTYEEDIGKQRSRAKDTTDVVVMGEVHHHGVNNSDELQRQGRKPNDRIPYLESHPSMVSFSVSYGDQVTIICLISLVIISQDEMILKHRTCIMRQCSCYLNLGVTSSLT